MRQIRNFYTGTYPNRELEVANGQTGTITNLFRDSVTVLWDPINGTSKERDVQPMTWKRRQKGKVENNIIKNLELDKNAKVYTSLKQLPLTLCWARTVHSSQGTTTEVDIDVDTSGNFLDERGNWKPQYGLAYVAISRVTDIKLMRFLTPLKSCHIAVDPKVKLFYESMSCREVKML